MGARWPPGDSATGLWEPRRPAFPCPHTRLLLPPVDTHMEKGSAACREGHGPRVREVGPGEPSLLGASMMAPRHSQA